MLNKNIETFIGCDNEYEQSKHRHFRGSIRLDDFFPSRDTVCEQSDAQVNHSGLKRIALIKTKIWKTSPYLTAAIWN